MNRWTRIVLRLLPALSWAVLIFVLSANPEPYAVLPENWSTPTLVTPTTAVSTRVVLSKDELIGRFMHVGEYAVLAGLVLLAIVWKRRVQVRSVLITLGVSSLYAFSDEIHQHFVPGRAFEWGDLGLDFFGMLVGCLLVLLINKGTGEDRRKLECQ